MTPLRSRLLRRASLRWSLLWPLLWLHGGALAADYPGTISLHVDATDIARRIYQVKETIPVEPGALTLLYPQWIPGNHSPTGPLPALAGLRMQSNGQRVEWRRDPVNLYAFHLTVPEGAKQLELQFEFLSPQLESQGRIVMTPELLGLQWNTVVLYPADHASREVSVQPTITLPPSWQFASALEVDHRDGQSVTFRPTTLETVLDSPLFAGMHFKSVSLAKSPPVRLNVVADSPESLQIGADALAAYSRLTSEAYALFGAHHYDHYDFLLALSDSFGDIGLEHHRSSENRHDPNLFTEWNRTAPGRDLLAHEYVHSWNGKFRRPADLATASYNVPMQNSMLWVYEGLTDYWGSVLAARSGLWSAQQAREAWAETAAILNEARPGREWRSLSDTTMQPILAYKRRQPWFSWQRNTDYYSESQLIWLDVDTRIRELTHERRSLDDFAKAFCGSNDGERGPLTYTFDDVVRALNAVAPFDWAAYLNDRLSSHAPGAPLDGLSRGGWQLVYTDQISDYMRDEEATDDSVNLMFSIGAILAKDGQLSDVRWGGPAYQAGLGQGTRIIAVDGLEYSADRLKQAIRSAKGSSKPIELLVKNLDHYRTVAVAWNQGLRYPHLQRVTKSPDRFSSIMQARASQ